MRTVCVYCGSGFGTDPVFEAAARALGRQLAEAGIALVYGGGNVGLMGTVARSVLDHDGHVTGIIPDFLKSRERMLYDVQETIVVSDMHTRKKLMFDRSDAFVAMPGGIGTLEDILSLLSIVPLGVEGVIVGRALYDGTVDLAEALQAIGPERLQDALTSPTGSITG